MWFMKVPKAIFKKLGLALGFLPRPLVVQDRNPHSYMADFEAELPLYLQSKALAELVTSQEMQSKTFKNVPQFMEKLWIDFYERGYIEIQDVYHVQKWLKTLCEIGYKFPSTKIQILKDSNAAFKLNGVKSVQKFEIADFECSLGQNQVSLANSDLHRGCRSFLASTISHFHQKSLMLGLKGNFYLT